MRPPVAEGVGGWRVHLRTLHANVYLLDGPEGRLIVDAGALPFAPQFARLLRAFRPDALLVTHRHVDHTSGAFLAARRGLPVLAHPAEHPFLAGERHDLPLRVPGLGERVSRVHPKVPPQSLRGVSPGEQVHGWTVLHLPGHTAGQLGLMRDGVLIAGDAVVGSRDGAHLPRPVYSADHRGAEETLRHVAELDLRLVLPGHGPPLTPEQVRRRARRGEVNS
ncbi:MBL fold metallo-hydrolase [Deinococcus sp. YIM 134068]|uniref:MBL fold metallo-hydrolase n=1 Tax=Deinococcus lichenicola TaxID=3118910 RepID=UPI002F95DA1C